MLDGTVQERLSGRHGRRPEIVCSGTRWACFRL